MNASSENPFFSRCGSSTVPLISIVVGSHTTARYCSVSTDTAVSRSTMVLAKFFDDCHLPYFCLAPRSAASEALVTLARVCDHRHG